MKYNSNIIQIIRQIDKTVTQFTRHLSENFIKKKMMMGVAMKNYLYNDDLVIDSAAVNTSVKRILPKGTIPQIQAQAAPTKCVPIAPTAVPAKSAPIKV